MEIRKLPALPDKNDRIETGAIQFGEDWPGIFIRGDNVFSLLIALETAFDDPSNVIARIQVDGWKDLLSDCIVGPMKNTFYKSEPTEITGLWNKLITAAPSIVCPGCRNENITLEIDGKVFHELYPDTGKVQFECKAANIVKHLIAVHPERKI